MKKRLIFSLLVLIGLMFSISSCKTEYERIRTSTDPKLLLESANKYYSEKDYLKAQTLYEMIVPFYRGKAEAEEIYFKFAYTHYYMKEYVLAAHYFKSFSTTFYNSKYEEEADFMTAYSEYMMSPSFRLDQTYSQKAINSFQVFINKYRNSNRVEEANKHIDELRAKLEKKDYDQAMLYFDLKQYQSAIRAFDNLLRSYPDTEKSEEIHYLMLDSAYRFAENSIYERKEERYSETLEYFKKFSRKFPDSKKIKDAEKIYADAQNKLKSFRT